MSNFSNVFKVTTTNMSTTEGKVDPTAFLTNTSYAAFILFHTQAIVSLYF